jgi:hypothetical protein
MQNAQTPYIFNRILGNSLSKNVYFFHNLTLMLEIYIPKAAFVIVAYFTDEF